MMICTLLQRTFLLKMGVLNHHNKQLIYKLSVFSTFFFSMQLKKKLNTFITFLNCQKKNYLFFFVVSTKLSPMYSTEEMSGENSKYESSSSAKSGRIVKEKFTQAEDDLLKYLVSKYGTNKWNLIGSLMCGRNSRQCRDRWNHYLCDENLNHDDFTKEDDELLMKLYSEVGHRWTIIAKHFERRNSVIVRNRIFKLLRKFNKQSREKIKTKEKKKKANSIVYLMPTTESLCNPHTHKDIEKRTIFPSCSSLPFVLDESQFTLFNQ